MEMLRCLTGVATQSVIPSINLSLSKHGAKALTIAGLMCESSSEVKCINSFFIVRGYQVAYLDDVIK